MQYLALLATLLGTTSAATIQTRKAAACNNSPDLCPKAYSAVTHLGAHNSPFLRDASTRFSSSGNQYFNTTVQLNAGVRLLTGQVHESNGEWHLCHTSCDLLDAGLLSSWLGEIKEWMDSNPSDVVSLVLVNSDDAKPSQLAAEFKKSGITKYAYTPPSPTTPPKTWPTLQELISANTRLVSFVASLDSTEIDTSTAYLMNEFNFVFETPFENINQADFKCTPDRPASVRGQSAAAVSSGRLPLQNHFLYDTQLFGIEAPDEANITSTNAAAEKPGNLGDATKACQKEWARPPAFILVDFFDQGPAITVVDQLNGVTNPVGRIQPPPRDTKGSPLGGSRALPKALNDLVKNFQNGENPPLGAWIWSAADWSQTFGGWDPTGKR